MKVLDTVRQLHKSLFILVRPTCPVVIRVSGCRAHLEDMLPLARLQQPLPHSGTGTALKTCFTRSYVVPVRPTPGAGTGVSARSHRWLRVGTVIRDQTSFLSSASRTDIIALRMFGNRAGGEGFSGDDDGESVGSGGDESGGVPNNGPQMAALTPMVVPEVFPVVPLIAVSRNPVFPRFIKIVEVSMM